MKSSAPTKRHPSMATHTGVSSKLPLEQSLWLLDIQDDPSTDTRTTDAYSENSQAFEEIVASADIEYTLKEQRPTLQRQSSVRKPIVSGAQGKASTLKRNSVRRHSTYCEREREKAYKEHKGMKEYLNSLEDHSKSKVATMLLEFNSSMSMASLSDVGVMNASPAMHYSCPVLSYMNDDEEDSVELTESRMKGTKRLSMVSISEESAETWETLHDDPLEDPFQNSKEYHLELKRVDDDFKKPRAKRRRSPSCLVLTQQLAAEGPQHVLRSFQPAN
ncbi:hypothetical protein MHU86_19486 [Fragilaria crotonensis]|nr:hypothetical protein MHU86_19486 [Fragilaria crotonensis]